MQRGSGRWRVFPLGALLAAALAVSQAFPGAAAACSISGAEVFKPTLTRFNPHPGPGQKDRSKGDYWEKVPAPVVEVIGVKRGTKAPGASCDDAGILSLAFSLPTSSTYKIDQFAVYFRVLQGRLPDEIFPDIPLVGRVQGGRMEMLLAWLDGHPSRQIPLDLKVEVFLVTNGLNIGPSTIFEVKG